MGNPAFVDALRVATSGANDVQLSWTGVSNAPLYDARRAAGATMSGATPIGTTGALSLLDPGARTDGKKIVYYQVRGRNACGVEGP